MHLPI